MYTIVSLYNAARNATTHPIGEPINPAFDSYLNDHIQREVPKPPQSPHVVHGYYSEEHYAQLRKKEHDEEVAKLDVFRKFGYSVCADWKTRPDSRTKHTASVISKWVSKFER